MKIYSYECEKRHTSDITDEKIVASVKQYLREKNISAETAYVGVRRDEYGKPHITGADGIFVSVTHAESLMLVAVAPYEIGIDAEHEGRHVRNPASLARRYFCKDEIGYLGEKPTEAAFTDMWVKKEALSKLLGKGVPAMREMSVFSEKISLQKQNVYSGYVVYTSKWK